MGGVLAAGLPLGIGAALGGGGGMLSSLFAGAGSSLLGGALNWGLSQGSAEQSYDLTRKLRRRAYQDMVYSLKQAGLNPILATGASPGNFPVTMRPPEVDLGAATLGGINTGLAAARNPADIALANARSKESLSGSALKQQERDFLTARRFALMVEVDKLRTEMENIRSSTGLNAARAISEVAKAGLLKRQTSFMDDQVKRFAAEIGKLGAETTMLNRYGRGSVFDVSSWGQTLSSFLGSSAKDANRALGGEQPGSVFNDFRTWFNKQGEKINYGR